LRHDREARLAADADHRRDLGRRRGPHDAERRAAIEAPLVDKHAGRVIRYHDTGRANDRRDPLERAGGDSHRQPFARL
jgi:hypothetical protein